MVRRKISWGFTLVELLVVIAIIALLLTMLTPALHLAREQAKMVVCSSNLRAIGLGVLLYLEEYDERFHNSPNGGKWDDIGYGTNNTGEPLLPDPGGGVSYHAVYWGIAYNEFIEDRKVFRCPSSQKIDTFGFPPEQYLYKNSTYGLNNYVSNQQIAAFKRPDEVILCQDHIESRLDDNGDMLYFINGGINMPQWRINYQATYPDAEREIFRHKYLNRGPRILFNENGMGYCNTLWLDGHVEAIPGGASDTGEDVPVRWYNPF